MTIYSQVQFPQASSAGFTYQANSPNQNLTNYSAYIPSTATLNGAITPPNWDPYSANAADRVMYLPDANGTMSYDQVMVAAYGLPYLQSQTAARLQNQMSNELSNGVSVTLNGTTYTVAVSGQLLATNLSKVMAASMIVNSTPNWAADTAYAPNSMVNVNGTILFTSNGGTSSSTEPTPPTAFQTNVTDGTVEWALMGLMINLANSQLAWFTPANVIELFKLMMLAVTDSEAVLLSLLNQVNTATDYTTLAALNYPSLASTSNTASASA